MCFKLQICVDTKATNLSTVRHYFLAGSGEYCFKKSNIYAFSRLN
jgi:hypothetical protein